MRRVLVVAAAAAALLLPAVARAHVIVSPAYLEAGQRSTLTFGAPNEREHHAVTRLTVTAPPGVELFETSPPKGLQLTANGRTAVWTGRMLSDVTYELRIEAKATRAPGSATFQAVQRYDDGKTVHWTVGFTVLPAAPPPKQHLWPAFLAGIVGVVVIAGGLAFLRTRGGRRARRAESRR